MKIIQAIRVLLVTLVACWCLTGFSQTTNSFFQFVQDQSQRQYTQVPHEVLAFYYGWYGQHAVGEVDGAWGAVDTNNHITERTARYPVKGAYDSHDPAIIDWQIDQAKAHGITGFIISWWGIGAHEAWHDQSLSLLMERAEKKHFKVSIYWEQAPGDGQGQIDRAIGELSYVLQNYGKNNAFLKVSGKPVIFVYGRAMFQVPVASWPAIIERVRAHAGDFALVADGHQNSYAYLLDGIHSYDLSGLPDELSSSLQADKLDQLRAWIADYYKNGVGIARQRGRISCVMVTPGGDARKAYKINNYTDRLDGQMYSVLWEEAIKANPDWVIITSWNEWPEGSEIEPSLELGDKYLQITAEYAKRFLNSSPVDVPPPTAFPEFVPGTTNKMDEVLSGKKVGLLVQNRSNDAEFWAAYCGASLQRFDWPDLINPAKFSAEKFPLFIYIGGEHFISSVKITDDVTSSLVRYLHEGGFLVTLPVGGVWPFFYDQSRSDKPMKISDRLGLAVTGSWDTPPTGSELKFYVNKAALLGLPPTSMYPANGDLRFRPATRSQVTSYDYYLPLVQLWDAQMHFQGDAAVYIEHKSASLSPGKTIYVSMQTPGALGPNEFYPSLYQFISTKLKSLPADK
jgi:glycoprotein endo-alpha-1,2-mannosidase